MESSHCPLSPNFTLKSILHHWNIDDVLLKTRNLEPKNWSLFDMVGIYSSGVKMTLKVGLVLLETTYTIQWAFRREF